MDHETDKAARRRAAIKLSENPYASLELEGAPEQQPEASPRDRRRAYIRLLENQYASLSLADEPAAEGNDGAASVQQDVPRRMCSKAEFRAGCRQIFLGYIPAPEAGKLRTHHRDFIARNESRSPTARFRLLAELSKYDLSSEPGLRAQFNRERDIWTEDKLRKVERDTDES